MEEYPILSKRIIEPISSTLVYCEGADDELFVRHIKKLYPPRGNRRIKIKNNGGGGPTAIVRRAQLQAQQAAFEYIVICMDNDWSPQQRLKQALQQIQVFNESPPPLYEVILWQPCLEAVVLEAVSIPSPDGCETRIYKDLVKDHSRPNGRVMQSFLNQHLNTKVALMSAAKRICSVKKVIDILHY